MRHRSDDMTEIVVDQNDSKGRLWLILLIGIAIGVIGTMLFSGPKATETPITGEEATSTATTTEPLGTDIKSKSTDAEEEVAAIVKTTPKAETATPAVKLVGGSGLKVDDQSAGSEVQIASVSHTGTVWVAVRELKNGEPWNVLGARRLEDGMNDTIVYLLRNTTAGATYIVTLYKENGDGVFDKHSDTEVKNADGDLVAVKFKAL